MIPRAQLDTVGVEDGVATVLEQMRVGHTRYPVLGSSSEELHGVIHLHDLLDLLDLPTGGTVRTRTRTRDAVIAEELVGEIDDEHDPAVDRETAGVAVDGWTVPGGLHIDEVERILGHQLPPGDFETLAGAVIAQFGGFPAPVTSSPLRSSPTRRI